MEDTEKAPESDSAGDAAGDLRAFMDESDVEEGGEFSPEVPIKEELVEEVMQQLWKEINSCQGSDSNTTSPSPEHFPGWSSSFVAFEGNKESCGPSYSGTASTVMAGIEIGGESARRGGPSGFVGPNKEMDFGSAAAEAGNGSCVVEESGGGVLGEEMEGRDGKEVDDEWLTRVLGWGPQELDGWF